MLKRTFLTLAALAATSGSPAQLPNDRWHVASTPDGALIVRYRGAFPDWVDRKSWPNLVGIKWPLEGKAAMPSKDESTRQYRFEDALQGAVEVAHVGVLAVVITGDGYVEWLYYSPSHDKFMATLNEALRGKPPLPLQISLEQDPDWVNYTDFAEKTVPR